MASKLSSPHVNPLSQVDVEQPVCEDCEVLMVQVLLADATQRPKFKANRPPDRTTAICPCCKELPDDDNDGTITVLPFTDMFIIPNGDESVSGHMACPVIQTRIGGSTSRQFPPGHPYLTLTGSLAITPAGATCPYDASPRIMKPKEVDYEWARDCIDACERNHVSCNPETSALSSVLGFQLIDCEPALCQPKVVPAPPGSNFVALSYVWGPTTAQNPGHSLTTAPRVVRDSIEVTRRLGYRYLWVDRYCIPEDGMQKHNQILQMDIIYLAASLTIIDAVGRDADHGLLGVSGRRVSQKIIFGRSFTLVRVKASPVIGISWKHSPWGKRGWTLQEGFLAKRRLVFGRREAVFICGSRYANEAIRMRHPLRSLEELDDFAGYFSPKSFDQAKTRMFKHNRLGGHFASWVNFQDVLKAYDRRCLTYSSDRLFAMSGILSSFESHAYPIHHAWGVPIVLYESWAPLIDWNSLTEGGDGTAVKLGLGWTGTLVDRLYEFPSWSWAGWKLGGSLAFRVSVWETDAKIEVMTEMPEKKCNPGGQSHELSTLVKKTLNEAGTLRRLGLSRYIWVTASTISLRTVKSSRHCDHCLQEPVLVHKARGEVGVGQPTISKETEGQWYIMVPLGEHGRTFFPAVISQHCPSSSEGVEKRGQIIFKRCVDSQYTQVVLLLLMNVGAYYERVGFCQISTSYGEEFEPILEDKQGLIQTIDMETAGQACHIVVEKSNLERLLLG